jgi:hypothetical protein
VGTNPDDDAPGDTAAPWQGSPSRTNEAAALHGTQGVTASPWREPIPPGIASATDSFYQVAAPLLAGFSATIIALTAGNPSSLRAGWIALSLAVLAFGMLLLSVEVGVHAKSQWATPSQYLEWHSAARHDEHAWNELRRQQLINYEHWYWYQIRAGRLYNAGLLSFLGTIVALVVPPEAPRFIPDVALLHYVPLVIASAFVVIEVWWIACNAKIGGGPRGLGMPGRRFFVPLALSDDEVPLIPADFKRESLH